MFYKINNNNQHLDETQLIHNLKTTSTISKIYKCISDTQFILLYDEQHGVLNRYSIIEYQYFPEFYGNIYLTDFDTSLINHLTNKYI